MSVTPYASPSPSPGATPWVPLWPLSPGGMSGLTVLYDALASTAVNDFDITNIPQTFRQLRLAVSLRSTEAAMLTVTLMQLNGDTNAGSYYMQQLRGAGATADSINLGGSGAKLGNMAGASAQAGYFAAATVDFPYYSGAQPKMALAHWYRWSADADQDTGLVSSIWKQIAPITRIRIIPAAGQWVAGSRVTLYGVDPMTVQIPTVNPSYGTAFPASPIDGQEHILVDFTNGPTYSWRFRYNALSSSPYKWEFIGGPPLALLGTGLVMSFATAGAWQNVGSAALIVPRAGVYQASSEMTVNGSGYTAASAFNTRFSGTSTGAKTAFTAGQFSGNHGWKVPMTEQVTLAAGETLTTQVYLTAAITANVYDLMQRLVPVRVS